MNGNPTAEQKRWHNWIIENSLCAVSDEQLPELHHIAGAKKKLKGVKGFGEIYCIGLSYWWHRDGNNKFARHQNKKQFEKKVGETEKEMWQRLALEYYEIFGYYPCKITEEEYQIILERA